MGRSEIWYIVKKLAIKQSNWQVRNIVYSWTVDFTRRAGETWYMQIVRHKE
jgi:hypothetical protein